MAHKLESRLLGEVSITSDLQMTPLMAENKEKLKSLLMRVKEESEKAVLKFNIKKNSSKIMASGPITSWKTEEEKVERDRFYFLGLQNHCRQWLQPWNSKMFAPWKESYDKPSQYIKKQWHLFDNKGPYSQSYGFSSSHVGMLDHKEGWVTKNRCFQILGLEKTLESPVDCKKIKPVNPKGNWSWIFIGKTDTEAPILWPPDEKRLLIGKDPDAGKDWRQEEKGEAEDEIDG